MAERTSLLYIYLLTSIKVVFASSVLQSANSCNVFPPSVRLLCDKLGTLWTNDNSRAEMNSVHDIGDMTSIIKEHHGNSAIEDKWETKGCSMKKCKICPGLRQCKQCIHGYFLQFNAVTENGICVRKCHKGYRRHVDENGNAFCKRVSQGCNVRKCLECIDSHACSVCDRGYYPQFNANSEKIICVKKCFVGYALNADHRGKISCTEIPSPVGCSDFLCTSCRRGHYMQPESIRGPMCKRKCPEGYVKDRIRQFVSCIRRSKNEIKRFEK